MRLDRAFVCVLVAAVSIGGCGFRNRLDVAAALRELLVAKPSTAKEAVWTDVRSFYDARAGEPAWVADDDTAKAEEALQVLRMAEDHGLAPADYGEAEVVMLMDAHSKKDALKTEAPGRAKQLAKIDATITTALLSLGRDVALGRTNPQTIDSRWKARRAPPDLVGTLTTATQGDLKTWLDAIRPRHPHYAALQKALIDLRSTQTGEVADDRVTQLALNLDRWRWMPDDLGPRRIVVNIPSFHLTAWDNNRPVLTMKVVVGKPEHKTPIFSSEMATVVFSPYWNVPDSIVEGETAPAAARDPGFLARNNIEILRLSKSGTATVDPSKVNWDDPEELRELAFRQKPGAQNALGHVKFLFPNPFDVYLHDTPADQLFARPGRAFSHGCVRVEKPEDLASWVLKDSPEWDGPKILEAMHAGVEKHVKLKQTIPVHIVYFTAWVDDAGTLHFEPDVYGYDAKQSSD